MSTTAIGTSALRVQVDGRVARADADAGLARRVRRRDGLRAAGRPDEVHARVMEEVLRDLERRVRHDLQRVRRQARASPASWSISIARVAQRAARADGRKIIALRVFAATIALNSAVDVGFVIGSSASTTPIGSATYWIPRSVSSLDHADRALVLEVVVEELGRDVVLDRPCPRARRSRSPPWRAGRGRSRSRGPATTIAQTIRSTVSWSSARSASGGVRARCTVSSSRSSRARRPVRPAPRRGVSR